MGSFLDKPRTDKHNTTESNDKLSYGLSSMQGWRIEMEDAHTCALKLPVDNLSSWSFFAVYDGHAGSKVAEQASHRLLPTILEQDYFKNTLIPDKEMSEKCTYDVKQIEQAIITGFLQLDAALNREDLISGCTVIGLLISPKHLFYINCGDSRALLVRKGPQGSQPSLHPDYVKQQMEEKLTSENSSDEQGNDDKYNMRSNSDADGDATIPNFTSDENYFVHFGTKDHKPVNPEEKNRIEAAGGMVIIQRINGALAVSRALGDFDYKRVDNLPPKDQLVSPVPEITCIERSTENDTYQDAFAIIACDGIYDAVSNEALNKYVSHKLHLESKLDVVAANCLDACLHRGSRDNMSLILLTFNGKSPKVSTKCCEIEAQIDLQLKSKVKELIQTLPRNVSQQQPEFICQHLHPQKYGSPGVGILGKRDLIAKYCEEFKPSYGADDQKSAADVTTA